MRALIIVLPLMVEVAAIVDFIRRRPNMYWLWIIIMGGPLGAGIYLVMEVLPDHRISTEGFRWYTRRKRIKQLELIVLDNPAPGNYEELADLYSEEKKFDRARQCFDKAISSRTDMPNPFYGRAIVELHLNDRAAAKSGTKIGLAENIAVPVPVIETAANIAAAERAMREMNASYLTVLMEGKYTDEYLKLAGADAPKFTTEDLKIISSPLDFVG